MKVDIDIISDPEDETVCVYISGDDMFNARFTIYKDGTVNTARHTFTNISSSRLLGIALAEALKHSNGASITCDETLTVEV